QASGVLFVRRGGASAAAPVSGPKRQRLRKNAAEAGWGTLPPPLALTPRPLAARVRRRRSPDAEPMPKDVSLVESLAKPPASLRGSHLLEAVDLAVHAGHDDLALGVLAERAERGHGEVSRVVEDGALALPAHLHQRVDLAAAPHAE